MLAKFKLTVGDNTFIILSALFFTLCQNVVFFMQVWKLIEFNSIRSVLFALSIPLLLFVLLNLIFSLLLQPGLRKLLLIAFILISATVNYFMFTFNIVIDGDMIENALATNLQESSDLVTFKMVLWITLFGIIPALIVINAKFKPISSWFKGSLLRLANIIGSLLVVLLIALFFYKDYASFIRNNKVVMKYLTPSNYVAGVVKVIRTKIDASRPFIEIGQDAQKGTLIENQPKKTLVVVVVGETARAKNFSLGGYERNTNPKLGTRDDIIYFQQMSSCGTATAVSLPCMFSNMPREIYNASKARYQSSVVDIIAKAGVDVLWRDNDGGCKGVCDRVKSENMTALTLPEYCKEGACIDEILLYQLTDYLDNLNNDGLLLLHQMGSHGPSYYRRYTDDARVFTPTCDSNSIQDCDTQSLVNTYDNTVVYTDKVLDKLIGVLEQYKDKYAIAMVYVSDHGESLGEKGLYLHGAPYAIAPSEQTEVPLLMWMTPDYLSGYQIDSQCVRQNAKTMAYSHDNLFHTLLGLLDVKTSEYDANLDMLYACKSL